MGLYERLTGEETPRIPAHALSAFMGEYERGKLTAQQVTTALNLSPAEATEAATLLAKMVPPREAISLGGLVTLTNIGTTYDNTTAAHGLGVALVQTAGITQVVFGVRVQKVGSGTQSWQLWNDTDGTEIGVIDDAAAAGQPKNLSTTINFDPALGAGLKVVRVRAKSTTNADDPVYFGAAISIRRVSVLTALELHEVLLCGDYRGSQVYQTAASLKARLGIA